ncbi:hypothetical protein OH76DRAFT_852916 [Lentinus brumalis]|uniref:Uncharacterized protein n=1 Tax=Lentinus brumalis TaxID=2498619 RepID=A0A371DR08_9APHY|nr:hypothetical protein OH76DRAFT_852916 [Polyporus brumalis]
MYPGSHAGQSTRTSQVGAGQEGPTHRSYTRACPPTRSSSSACLEAHQRRRGPRDRRRRWITVVHQRGPSNIWQHTPCRTLRDVLCTYTHCGRVYFDSPRHWTRFGADLWIAAAPVTSQRRRSGLIDQSGTSRIGHLTVMCRWGEEQAQTFVRHGEGRPGGADLFPAGFSSVHSHVEAAPPVRGVGLSSDVPARTATADVKADARRSVCLCFLCCRHSIDGVRLADSNVAEPPAKQRSSEECNTTW